MPAPDPGTLGDPLTRLFEAMRHASTLEQGSLALLSELSSVVSNALQSSSVRGARLERAVLHLRPGGGYQGVLVLVPGRREIDVPDQDPSYLSSATAWQHVRSHGAAVAIDVLTGTLVVESGDPSTTPRPQHAVGFDGTRTLALMRKRQTTHLLVLPVLDVGRSLVGQLSIETHCPQAVGQRFVWSGIVDALQALVDLAAPHLLRLPARTHAEAPVDPMLPVVGALMQPIVRNLRVFARHDETILLLGATGTGKSQLARWCHARSHRAEGPFEVVDLNAIPSDLQQGELFGWRKGSFTGAARDQVGAVGRARDGTLFIDEIDKLDLRAQASLLRLLEDGSYRAIGSGVDELGDVRFIVGTNADLEQAITDGRFLPDLYYRINVLPIRLPTLAERRDEIADWARFMVARRAGTTGSATLDPSALQPLLDHRWPGNLRQLDNVIRRAFALALVDRPEPNDEGGPLLIELDHVMAALTMEQSPRASSPTRSGGEPLLPMRRAAAWVAEHAARRHEQGQPLPLDMVTAAFRGLVMLAAVEHNELEVAFESLGRANLIKSRNHHKSLRTAKAQIEALTEAIDSRAREPAEDST